MRVTPDDLGRYFLTFGIYLDGKEVKDAVMADDKSGEVEVLIRIDGMSVIDGDSVKTEILTGEVVIKKRYSRCE